MLAVPRRAFRALARSPGFTLAAVATFAIGIGANATVFGVVNAVLLKSYPYRDAERIVALYESDAAGSGNDRAVVSPANFRDWQASARSFASMAAARGADFTLGGDGERARLSGARVTWTLPQALGVAPQVGRAFAADDDVPGAPAVVMIADRLWRTRFGADPGVVGRVLQLNGRPATVIGVLPAGVRYPDERTEVWAPFAMSDSAWRAQRGNHNLSGVGRLAPGVTPAAAQAEPSALQRRIGAEFDEERNHVRAPVVPLHEAIAGAAALTGLLADELYDTSPLDAPVLVTVSLLVALIAAMASWVPARRAMRTSPMAVLRAE